VIDLGRARQSLTAVEAGSCLEVSQTISEFLENGIRGEPKRWYRRASSIVATLLSCATILVQWFDKGANQRRETYEPG
jgi:hypothetical protein